MQNNQSFDNSGPANGIAFDDISRITDVGGGVPRKRVAEDGCFTWRRKTAKNFGHWRCTACSTDNPDALSHRCSSCGKANKSQQRMEKRDSITSHESSSLNSFTIDDLVGNLEGLEFDLDVDTYKPSNNDSLNESTTSRFSAGNWSLRDLEKWSCSTCTFENEPVFCACEMCGQAKPVKGSQLREEAAAPLPSTTAILEGSRSNLDTSCVRVQQEQRLTELLQFRKPVATRPSAAVPDLSSLKSALPPLSWTAKRCASPKPPRSPMPPMKAKVGIDARRATHHSRSPVPPRGMPIVPGKEIGMGDVFDVQKPRRSFNPEDSAATATTFDMSSSMCNAFDMSASTEDQWFPEQIAYPGIEEVDEALCAESSHVRR